MTESPAEGRAIPRPNCDVLLVPRTAAARPRNLLRWSLGTFSALRPRLRASLRRNEGISSLLTQLFALLSLG